MTDSTTLISNIYNQVACIVLSKDESGETWAHFGVALRGHGNDRAPYLSTFGGSIDINEGKTEGVIEALARVVHEEALGLLDDEITFEKLTNPNLSYSFSYTNPDNMSSTVIFAIMVEYQKMEEIKKQFDQERYERLHQENNKKFNNR